MRKTQEEIDAMSPDELKAYNRGQQDIVYGSDAKRGKNGKPIEQGIGSPGRCNENHFAAIRNTEGPEAEKAARVAEREARKAMGKVEAA